MAAATRWSRSAVTQTPDSQSGCSSLSLPTPAVVIKRTIRGSHLTTAEQPPRPSDSRHPKRASFQSPGRPSPLSSEIPDSNLGFIGKLHGPASTPKQKRRLPWDNDSETESEPRLRSRPRVGDATETSSVRATPVPESQPRHREATETPSVCVTPVSESQPQRAETTRAPSIHATTRPDARSQQRETTKTPPVRATWRSQSNSRLLSDNEAETDSTLSTPRVAWSQPHDNTLGLMLPPPTRTLGESSRRPRASSQVSSVFSDGQSGKEADLDLTTSADQRARLAAVRARRDTAREQRILESEVSSLPDNNGVLGMSGVDLDRMSRRDRPHQTERQALETARLERMMTEIRPHQGRVARVRIGWSKNETRRLIKLWQLYGNSWSQIKGADEEMEPPRLTNRTQIDLKDKMRNVKAFMAR
jgi:hypothetical protein